MFKWLLNKDIRNIVIGNLIGYLIIWAPLPVFAFLKEKASEVSYATSISSMNAWVTSNFNISLTEFLSITTLFLVLISAGWIYHKVMTQEPISWDMDHFLSMEQWNEKGSMVWRIRCFKAQGINISDGPIIELNGYIGIRNTGERFPVNLIKDGNIVDSNEMLSLPPRKQVVIDTFFSRSIEDYSAWKGHNPSDFLNRYCPFTLVTKINGKQYKYSFSRKKIKEFIDMRISPVEQSDFSNWGRATQ